MIERFTSENRQVNLAVSLHAATDDLRSRLLPVNRRYPLSVLLAACRAYVERTRRRISFEWALIEGVNDTAQQAEALAALLAGLTCHVNLIPLNPTNRYAGMGSPRERAAAFRDRLQSGGIACTVRVRRGIDIQAGCGQLATERRLRAGTG
jgi:23S rRNA (adenine2503-C2)-methyltransferase